MLDELEIAEIFKTYADALEKHDSKLLLSLFDEDARIDSYAAGGMASLKEFANAIPRALLPIVRVSIRDLLIKIKSEREAYVYGVTRYDYARGGGLWHKRTWRMIKNEGKWRIIESKYHDFEPTRYQFK